MKTYRHELKGSRFYILLLFSLALLGLNAVILPGGEAVPVKVFALLLTLAWLAVTVDSLAAKVVVDEKGIGMFSVLFKRFAGWKEITEIRFGDKWVMATYMPEHIIICYQKNREGKTSTITLHNDLKNWRELLRDIANKAPSGAIPEKIRKKI